jgi:hypothetical protein
MAFYVTLYSTCLLDEEGLPSCRLKVNKLCSEDHQVLHTSIALLILP